ncbi:hypothetical protein CGRA01v4_14590 [Colletotrichum graminicola]|nr:hypothetical protein CGRA01v4_14590 [Colletotrichum graminicola]
MSLAFLFLRPSCCFTAIGICRTWHLPPAHTLKFPIEGYEAIRCECGIKKKEVLHKPVDRL